ncbi:LysR family transcriptional regulator [Salinisphaera sp. Q1T1-3]|uniref:LysR family transcriptional regulator n=1 Tax=Salinisphaera sp. Q1T1-3 TaxID=2321229 RepID=UPI000E719621|nr:LysR family transcriptional regulator [Salinisphaera sp. Q1T1-3]RJS94870.1 LysR family transcriptional regulator [Salinisphaera sp. Q1T1-3]
MRQFTLKQLRYFVLAGQLSSVTQAARKLHVSQPSISAAIQQLEEMTHLQLFVRHHAQGLTLTPAGKQLMTRARELLRDAEGLEKFAASLGDEIGGELRLVALPTFAPVLLPDLMRRFAARHPAVSLYCDEMIQGDIFTGLDAGDYELAFTYDLSIPETVDFTPLRVFPPYAVVAADHPLAGRESVSLAELADLPMVLLDWSLSREYFLSIFARHGWSPRVAHRVKSMDMLRGLVASGLGFSLFNTPLAAFGATTGLNALRIEEDAAALSMGIARPRGVRLAPAAEAMQGLAEQAMNERIDV